MYMYRKKKLESLLNKKFVPVTAVQLGSERQGAWQEMLLRGFVAVVFLHAVLAAG
jgi:hypothetical protein